MPSLSNLPYLPAAFHFLMKLPQHLAKESGKEMLYHFFVVTMRFIVYLGYN